MRLVEILQACPALPASSWHDAAALDLAGASADSRAMHTGFLFAALPGTRADGRAFIADAVARGACAVLAPEGTAWPAGVPARPLLTCPEPRRALAQIAAVLAGPAPATMVAVTGTNGKTSTVEFLRQIWTAAGHKAATVGTLGVVAEGHETGPGLTTPAPEKLAETLAALARDGVDSAALEASSIGLDQFRLDGLRFAAAAFTNLTRDHLDYHHTMAAYRAAKLRLFAELLPEGAPAVAHTALEPETMAALRAVAARRHLSLAVVGEGGEAIDLRRATPLPDGQEIELAIGGARQVLHLPLVGRFQADNALVAAALAQATGTADALAALPHLHGVRGRLERAAVLPNGAAVYVDFAHTPDGLEHLLAALRPHTRGRLHVVFGAGGDRDPGKRPLMGEVCARLADVAVVTDDNPRSEEPAAIRAAVLAGTGGRARDGGPREAAIASALSDLTPGDVLVVAGKGHEQGQTIRGVVHPFDDVAVVRRLVGESRP